MGTTNDASSQVTQSKAEAKPCANVTKFAPWRTGDHPCRSRSGFKPICNALARSHIVESHGHLACGHSFVFPAFRMANALGVRPPPDRPCPVDESSPRRRASCRRSRTLDCGRFRRRALSAVGRALPSATLSVASQSESPQNACDRIGGWVNPVTSQQQPHPLPLDPLPIATSNTAHRFLTLRNQH